MSGFSSPSLREALLASLAEREQFELSPQRLASVVARAVREPASLTLEEIRALGSAVLLQAINR